MAQAAVVLGDLGDLGAHTSPSSSGETMGEIMAAAGVVTEGAATGEGQMEVAAAVEAAAAGVEMVGMVAAAMTITRWAAVPSSSSSMSSLFCPGNIK